MSRWRQLQQDIADRMSFHMRAQIANGLRQDDAARESAMAALCAVTTHLLAITGKECKVWTDQHSELLQGFISDIREMPDRKESK